MASKTTSNAPSISVLMGIYNCENTLPLAIESILKQSFTDFDFIICDDGSKDRTYEIAKSYAKKDSRIVLLQNEKNQGLSATLNTCISHAKGNYFARMDGDDIAHKDRFKIQHTFLENHNDYALCGSSIEFIDDEGIWGKLLYPEYPIKKDFLLRSPFAHPTIMIRSEVMHSLNGYSVGKKVGRSEDYDLFMRLYALGFKGYNFQEILFSYREDRNAFHKRKFKFTLTEARVRFNGYKKLKLLPYGFIFVLKPILIGLIPMSLYRKMRKGFFK